MANPNDVTAPQASETPAAAAEAPPDGGAIRIEPRPPEPAGDTPAEAQMAAPRREWLAPERLAAEFRRLDGVTVGLVLVLAFFLGSFAARNSDVWMHLATGRLIAQGGYHFGSDPFAYTTAETGWINHAWLYDLVTYGVAQLNRGPEEGGGLLVVLKALLVAGTVGVMLLVRRRSQPLWLPAVCAAVAVVAMSPRLFLQPTCVSFLFVAVTLYVLLRPRLLSPPGARPTVSPYSWFVLPPLFALWVNLDDWYVLGPVTVALYWAGELIQQATAPVRTGEDAPTPQEQRLLPLVLALGVAACLVSPFHVRGLTLPLELQALISGGPGLEDPMLHSFLLSPLSRDYMTNTTRGLNAAGITYFVLIVLGLVSFELNRAGLRWWRVLLWGAFCLLSAVTARAVPFFAVVAGPITALNLQDYAARRAARLADLSRKERGWLFAGRVGTVAGAVALLALAWPGLLSGAPDDPIRTRRVGWDLEVDPSWRAAAEKLRELHVQGVLQPDRHGFNFLPDTANYCAWFCPEEKGYFDHRLLADKVIVASYVTARNLLSPDANDQVPDPRTWQALFSYRHIDHVVVSSTSPLETIRVTEMLRGSPAEWALLYVDGRTAVFGWLGPASPEAREQLRTAEFDPTASAEAFRKAAFVPELAAFGPAQVEPVRSESIETVEKQSPWEWYAKGPAPRPREVDDARMYLELYRLPDGLWPPKASVVEWVAALGSAAGTGRAGGADFELAVRMLSRMHPVADQQQLFQASMGLYQSAVPDAAPPAWPVLAVRAARRAVEAVPTNPDGYFALAQAYGRLRDLEGKWGRGRSAMLDRTRLTQIVTALQRAVTLRPDSANAHLALADAFRQMRTDDGAVSYIDLEVEHLQEAARLTKEAGPAPGQPDGDFRNAVKRLDDFATQRRQQTNLDRELSDYQFSAANKTPLVRATRAYQRGLVRQALDVLKDADLAELGRDGQEFYVHLLISTGQLEELRKAENAPDNKSLDLRVALAAGDYARAEEDLARLLADADRSNAAQAIQTVRQQTLLGQFSPESLMQFDRLTGSLAETADQWALRGVVALERGQTADAAGYFRRALRYAYPTGPVAARLGVLGASWPGDLATLTADSGVAARQAVLRFATYDVAANYLRHLRAAGH